MTFAVGGGRVRGAIRPSPVFLGIVALAVAGGVLAWTNGFEPLGRVGMFVLVIAGWIVSVCLHEFGHAYTAWKAGDRDVEMRGYLTLNPLKYTHPLLSIGMPLLFIAIGGLALPGGAVYLRTGGMDAATRRRISLAGPFVNAACAVALLAAVRAFGSLNHHGAFWTGLAFLAFLQITATILNLLPIPGFDGYGALEPSLSPSTRHTMQQIEPYGWLIFMALIFIPTLNHAFFDLIDQVFELSGISAVWSDIGNAFMRFWERV
ncbi:MAG: site-2 protease family protein [Mycobacteriaceae bacterium]|nr:site-2 protease family protein [Mycobacteriaceae bacterium]